MTTFPTGNTSAAPIIFPYTSFDLTSATDIIPNQWGLIGSMGLFAEEGINSTTVAISYRDGFISVLDEAARGTIPQADSGDQEAMVFIQIPHFPSTDLITAADIQDHYAFVPGDNQPRRMNSLATEMPRHLQKIAMKHDLTLEFLSMGALKGRLYDGKGKLLLDVFDRFGINQQVFTFNFSDPEFKVKQFTYDLARYVELNLHGDVSNGIEILVSPEFFDALTEHPSVEKFYLNWNAKFDKDDRSGFRFGACTFTEYNAQVPSAPQSGILQQQVQGQAGMNRFIEAEAGYGFPTGTLDTFRTFLAPPNVVSLANTRGIKRYVSPRILDHDKGVELFSESNVLPICKRPNVLFKVVAA